MSIENRLQELGLKIPQVAKPIAAYVPAVQSGEWVYTSGQIPLVEGTLACKGKVGSDLTQEQGYEAAKICALNCLAAVQSVIGDLNKIERIVKVTGFVNSAPGFNAQPAVVNGASELFGKLFGEKGTHARSAVGVSELPIDAPVEVEIIVKVAK